MHQPTQPPGMTRRQFIRNSAIAAVASAFAATTLNPQRAAAYGARLAPAAAPFTAFEQSAARDLEILNYALTLEHLEAKAYAVVNSSGLLSGTVAEYFKTIGSHETTHVEALTSTIRSLGGTPVQAQASYNFPNFKSQQEVLVYFQGVEELGAAAYLGQAPRLQNPDLITAAVSIHNVEAQHAALLSDLIGVAPSPAFGKPKTMEEVLAIVTPILMPAGAMPAQMPATGLGGGHQRFTGQRVP